MQKQLNPYIEYFSKFEEISHSSSTFEQSHNSLFISQLLSSIQNFPSMTINPSPKTFSDRFSNLKEIYNKLRDYWKNQLNLQGQLDEINIIEIASHQNIQQITKLLELVLKTGIQSTKKEYFIEKMLKSSTQTQNHFMNLIEKTLNQENGQSPRKQRERYLLDQIIILQQQNDGFYEVIKEYQKIKMELQLKNTEKQQRLKFQQLEIEKLNYKLGEITQTPQKKKQTDFFDTTQKNRQQIDRLKDMIYEMGKQHQKQIIALKQQVQFLGCKAQKLGWVQNELQMYKVKLQSNKSAIEQYNELNRKYVEMKRTLIDKTQTLAQYERKLQLKNTQIQSLQTKIVNLKLQVERKNVQLDSEVSLKYNYQPISSFSPITMNRTLSQQCPEVINNQTQHLSQINKELRSQLQRSSKTLKDTQAKLEKLKREYQKIQNYGHENKKLTQMLDQVSENADEEKYLLLGALYQIRMKYMKQVQPKQKILRNQTKRNLSRVVKK